MENMRQKIEIIKSNFEEVKTNIISYEDKIWEQFQNKVDLYKEQFQKYNVNLFAERYWINKYNKQYHCKERLKIEVGYEYWCTYLVKRNGLCILYGTDEEGGEMSGHFDFIKLRRNISLPRLFNKLKLFRNKGIFVEVNELDDKFNEEFKESMDEDLVSLEKGNIYLEFDSALIEFVGKYLQQSKVLEFKYQDKVLLLGICESKEKSNMYYIKIKNESINPFYTCSWEGDLLQQKIGSRYVGEIIQDEIIKGSFVS